MARWKTPTSLFQKPITARGLIGSILAQITHVTDNVSLAISGNHREEIVFYLLKSPSTAIVFGHPWLVKHNPHVSWSKNLVLAWSSFCYKFCLGTASSFSSVFSMLQEKAVDLTGVPVEYLGLRRVQQVTSSVLAV